MVCPKCNNEIPDGKLYCPTCGEEVIIVSDFDINLEDNIDTSVFTETTELPDVNGETKDLSEVIEESNSNDPASNENIFSSIPKLFWILGSIVCVVIVIVTILIVNAVRDFTSYDIQYGKAREYYDVSDYGKAIKTVKHAISLDKDEVEGYVLLADIYCAQNNYDAAIAVLVGALNDNPSLFSLYDRIIECYEAEGDYDSIHSMLIQKGDDSLKSKYASYFPNPPKASLESGTYVEPLPIQLIADGDGQIYYTTDGTEPSKSSLLYSESIPLEEGNNVINAIFINDKGILSECVEFNYIVENDIPDIPVVLTTSGSYNVPNPIGISTVEGVKYYYTASSNTPTEEDNLYEIPLFMPFGNSVYTFVAQNESGEYSQSITVNYDFSFAATIDKQVAEYAISYHLLTTGDTNFGYTYVSGSGYTQDSVSYYIVEEFNGTNKTGRLFAVDSSTGALYKVSRDIENQKYNFIPM